jgi:hypothetical protein
VTRSTQGRVVVSQQPDGWWRWRFVPTSPKSDALVSAEAYPERDEAVQSAREAYPALYPVIESPQVPRHRMRALVRRAGTAAMVVAVVVAAARSGNRSRPSSRD